MEEKEKQRERERERERENVKDTERENDRAKFSKPRDVGETVDREASCDEPAENLDQLRGLDFVDSGF